MSCLHMCAIFCMYFESFVVVIWGMGGVCLGVYPVFLAFLALDVSWIKLAVAH